MIKDYTQAFLCYLGGLLLALTMQVCVGWERQFMYFCIYLKYTLIDITPVAKHSHINWHILNISIDNFNSIILDFKINCKLQAISVLY